MHKGFSRAVYAVMTGETTETYGTVKDIPKGVKVEIKHNNAEGEFYAYDQLDEQDSEFSDADVTIEVGENTKQMEADLLGHSLDSNGAIIYGKDDAPPYVAFGYEIKLSKNKVARVWLHKVKFKQPDESAQTKTNSFQYGTATLTGKAQPRSTDGFWKSKAFTGDAGFNNFFSSVYIPNGAANTAKGALEALTVYAESINISSYTSETAATFTSALTSAESALEDSSQTQTQLDAATQALITAINGLALSE